MHKYKEIIGKKNTNAKRKFLPRKKKVQRRNMEFIATKRKQAKKKCKVMGKTPNPKSTCLTH